MERQYFYPVNLTAQGQWLMISANMNLQSKATLEGLEAKAQG
jgi:hypothetical protein